MSFSLSSRGLLRGMLAGAVVLTGTACSRSDRAESGRGNSAAVLGDNDAAGYRPMERDTTNVPSQDSDSARVTADTADASSASSDTSMSEASIGADTTAVGSVEMARDTSTVADQADTAAASNGEVALKATIDTSSQANAAVSAETGIPAAEDSTELLGHEAVDETADEQVLRPEDRETVAASETPTDEVGAAAIGGNVTGADAVALMSRQGLRCALVDPEANEAVRWDMSNTPVALNPCGVGSMNLSRIWTEK